MGVFTAGTQCLLRVQPFLPSITSSMRLPKVVQRAENAKTSKLIPGLSPAAGISKTGVQKKKKRGDKLRALASAFNTEAQRGEPPCLAPIDPMAEKYELHEQIGQGKHGVSVSRCTERATGNVYAVKCVPKALLGRSIGDERQVIGVLRGGSQLVNTHQVLEGSDALYYILEFAAGGDLFEYIVSKGRCDENRARALFAGILAAIQQVHSNAYIHRDIKLENILLMHPDPAYPEQVRLADFEFCIPFPAVGPVGSLPYAAPEALDGNQQYSSSADLWAAGCVLYSMLSAAAPFDAPLGGMAATAERIRNAQPNMPFSEPCWTMISPAAKDLVNGLLHPNPLCRLTLEAAILHPWLSGSTAQQAPPPARPKFSMRCTWHSEAKRWSNQSASGVGVGELRMLVDDGECSPLVACPLEWGPTRKSRGRANSL